MDLLRWLACVWLWATPVSAQPRVDWQATAGCPGADEAQLQIERLLRSPLAAIAISLTATVRLHGSARAGFVATIEVRQAELARTRVLHSEDCAVLAHAAAVVVALAIDPSAKLDAPSAAADAPVANDPGGERSASTRRSAPGPTPASATATARSTDTSTTDTSAAQAAQAETQTVATAAAAAASPPALAPPSESAAAPAADGGGPASADLRPFLGAAVALNTGMLPKWGPAFALAGGVDHGWLHTVARLSYALAQSASLEQPARVASDISLAFASLQVGPRMRAAGYELSGVAGLEAGLFSARGTEGAFSPQTEHPLWLGASLGGALALALGANLAIALQLEAVLALRRPIFTLQSDLGQDYRLYRPSLLAGRGWLQIELRLAP
jgi:hypothetical protein